MAEPKAEMWTYKQEKIQEKNGSLENGDASQEMIARTAEYSCEVCSVNVNTYHDLEMHRRGRAHLVMVERTEVARRSIFVRGFTVTASIESDLRELLSQFGSLVMLVVKIDKEWDSGSYALAEFLREEEALKALKCSSPLTLHGNKVVVRPRQVKPVQRKVKSGRKQRLDLGQRCVAGTAPSEMDTAPTEVEASTSPASIGGIRLTKEAIAAITSAQSVDAQLEAIASHCRLDDAAAYEQLMLCNRLQSRFQSVYAKCMVIPFGASVSGHGTLSSDCDLSVLIDPLPVERAMFSGSAYFSQRLHSAWSQLEEKCPSNIQPKVTTMATHYHSTFPQTDPSYDHLLALVEGDTECEQVLAIANARCPIIRFMYCPFNLHCDLSINNRLGPANTRLMAAYYQRDSRMAILVPIVRLWARAQGVQRSQLNNYALSLMLIHFLQTVSPPVLPCLQDPGVWPKDMTWIGAKGFSDPQQPLVIDGWKCDFEPPQSLLPSINTATPAELFMQFLHYYADCFPFSECVVAIHCHSPPLISQLRRGASSQEMEMKTIPAVFRVSSLCIQDPFELTHNVAKGMSRSHMSHFHQCLKSSQATLKELLSAEVETRSSRQDVISVFTQSHTAGHSQQPITLRTLSLSLEVISRLLLRTKPYIEIAQRLQELDMHSSHTHRLLSCIVLKALTVRLEEDFDFTVCLKTDKCEQPPDRFLAVTPQSTHPHTYLLTGEMEVRHEQQRKRQRPSGEAENVARKMVDLESHYCEEEGDEKIVCEGVKRSKLASDEQTAESLLHHLTEGGEEDVFLCTAVRKTWVHCRRKRRERKQMTSCSPSNAFDQTMSVLGDSLPSLSPYLIFTLALDEKESGNVCSSIKLQATHVKYSQPLVEFYAFFKKWLLHIT